MPDSIYQEIGVKEGNKRLFCCDGHALDVQQLDGGEL